MQKKVADPFGNWTLALEGRDVILVGLQPWYFETGCNAKNMALQLSKHARVLYVNFPIKRRAYLQRGKDPKIENHIDIIRERRECIHEVAPNVWELYPTTLIESANWIPSTRIFQFVNYLNNQRFAKDIKTAIKKLDFKEYILLNDNDIYNGFFLKELLSPSLYIYYMRDFLQGYSYWKRHTAVIEPQLIKKSDLVVTNSISFTEYCSNINPNSYYIGQGCSLDFFDYSKQESVPADIKNIKGPIIGYIGALNASRLDLDIVISIAKYNVNWNLVFVGHEDEAFKASVLHELPNVHFMGGRNLTELAGYVRSFDVCINPQLNNEITMGNYPLKVDEYLAMGKPVVATRTNAMQMFENYTYLAETSDDYPLLIAKALNENNLEEEYRRVAFARQHTWEKSIHDLYDAMILTKQRVKTQ